MSAPCPIFGFVVRARIIGESADADALRADLVEFLEANGLEIASSRRGFEYVISRDGSQATNSDRELVLEWAKRSTSLAVIHVSELFDLQALN